MSDECRGRRRVKIGVVVLQPWLQSREIECFGFVFAHTTFSLSLSIYLSLYCCCLSSMKGRTRRLTRTRMLVRLFHQLVGTTAAVGVFFSFRVWRRRAAHAARPFRSVVTRRFPANETPCHKCTAAGSFCRAFDSLLCTSISRLRQNKTPPGVLVRTTTQDRARCCPAVGSRCCALGSSLYGVPLASCASQWFYCAPPVRTVYSGSREHFVMQVQT